jgi:hypothetical protein
MLVLVTGYLQADKVDSGEHCRGLVMRPARRTSATRLLSHPVAAYPTILSYAAKLQDIINAWSFERMVLRTLDLESPHLQ